MYHVQQAEKDRAEFDAEWKELGKLIAQDRKLRETLRQRQLDRNRDIRCGPSLLLALVVHNQLWDLRYCGPLSILHACEQNNWTYFVWTQSVTIPGKVRMKCRLLRRNIGMLPGGLIIFCSMCREDGKIGAQSTAQHDIYITISSPDQRAY